MSSKTPAGKTATADAQTELHHREHVTIECRDCAWSVTQPTALRAEDFADAHENRHGHETGRRR